MVSLYFFRASTTKTRRHQAVCKLTDSLSQGTIFSAADSASSTARIQHTHAKTMRVRWRDEGLSNLIRLLQSILTFDLQSPKEKPDINRKCVYMHGSGRDNFLLPLWLLQQSTLTNFTTVCWHKSLLPHRWQSTQAKDVASEISLTSEGSEKLPKQVNDQMAKQRNYSGKAGRPARQKAKTIKDAGIQ